MQSLIKNSDKLRVKSSVGRLYKEKNNSLRSPFQRDRDRIVHSASFRRLKHKTQVFVNTDGDHYRTRLTHSMEVSQISRTIARALGFNEDLCETLSLAHDMGHTPFGHAGESILDECMQNFGGFDHNIQTLRIVLMIEKKYYQFTGLNLTIETLDGLLKHNGPLLITEKLNNIIGLKIFKDKINFKKSASAESQISAISDDIAYNNHDIQDGIRAGLFTIEDLSEIPFLNALYKKNKKFLKNNKKEIVISQIIRESINEMVMDVIKSTLINLKKNNINSLKDIYNCKNEIICFSNSMKNIDNEVKHFLRIYMYKNKEVVKKNNEGRLIIKKLFKYYQQNPNKILKNKNLKTNKERAISDFIAGMTDRYAINLYKQTL